MNTKFDAADQAGDDAASRPPGDTAASRPPGDTAVSRPPDNTAASRPPVDGGGERAPGESRGSPMQRVVNYLIGLALAGLLTGISFWVCRSDAFYAPGVPAGLCVLAIAQMGIHLVFFLHLNTGQDSTNNVLAVAFGLLIVLLLGVGTLWIMGDLNSRMAPMGGG